ncbi:DNA-binding MarR family transcriptional regulator [Actinoplanes lutulentus]|uniref:DNA-binding MarR family transcriptional regulator n=1 Tax=Actinoplanes lutulentus TaxID=1287878 RepID=A0A327ZDI4_9ACTN|nr:MarR family transcriptional regulator [Actinoplanes lutulentus]MBB2948528.1 DNA-binding MarR family transcriptional regulator [Actinoplanes lutulentus]RAK34440.1 DNA-binding MarR family transcriptional regulator [Actinoplanes lutulentus]
MTEATSEADIAERLRQSIGRFVRTVRARAATLPLPQAATLGDLGREGPQTIAQLAAGRGVKHQSMSRTVSELEARALVARTPDARDKRAVLLTLTAAGETALEADREARRRWMAAAIEARLTEDERRILHAVPDLLDRLGEGP